MDVSPLQVIGYLQDQLNRLYEASETGPIDWLVDSGARRYDIRDKIVFNDTAWKGYFPVGQILSAVAIEFMLDSESGSLERMGS